MKAISTNVAGGICLMALAVLALWLLKDVSQGTLNDMGPAMLPRWLAIGFGSIGLALVAKGVKRPLDRLENIRLRSPLLVTGAIVFFALTINHIGLAIATPLTMLIAGLASSETRWLELAIFSLIMTVISIALFRYALNVQLPVLFVPGLISI